MEFVRLADNITAAHYRVLGMNFIPDGYTILAEVWNAHTEAESQLVESGAVENETQPPSLGDDNKWREMQEGEELPPSPPDEVHIGSPHQNVDCPSQVETQSISNMEMPFVRESHTL